jgi:hypothetical protein
MKKLEFYWTIIFTAVCCDPTNVRFLNTRTNNIYIVKMNVAGVLFTSDLLFLPTLTRNIEDEVNIHKWTHNYLGQFLRNIRGHCFHHLRIGIKKVKKGPTVEKWKVKTESIWNLRFTEYKKKLKTNKL